MRKNVIWIVSALLIFAFAAFGVGNASAAEANTDSDFTIQAVEQTDSALTVSLTNRADVTAFLLCAAAAYNKDGRMLSVSAGDYTLNASQTARIAVSVPEEAASVKAFVLDASTLKPLRTAWKWERTEPDSAEKVLVAYFSATGTTKRIAATITDILGADSYEITPAVPYTSADLNYSNSSSRTTKEQNNASARPAIAGSVANMEQYKIVFLGYPIWWGQAPRIISTFLESYHFAGKTIVPFCTSGSSPIGNSATNLQPLASGAAWEAGRRFTGSSSRATIEEWHKRLESSAEGGNRRVIKRRILQKGAETDENSCADRQSKQKRLFQSAGVRIYTRRGGGGA